jgi:phosphatidylserine/phosphatidylglycerophosphate/cardiolipin synthase-like enzyme
MVRKSFLILTALIFLTITAFPTTSPAKDLILTNVPVQIYFSPQRGCTEAIVAELNKAKSEILVQAYSFTSKPIAQALVDAHKRGVHTEIILDKSNIRDKYSAADFIAHMGIPTYIDYSVAGIAHNKIMIIDQETVITGSFNFTKAAEENNAENLLIIRNKELAKNIWTIGRCTGGILRDI